MTNFQKSVKEEKAKLLDEIIEMIISLMDSDRTNPVISDLPILLSEITLNKEELLKVKYE